MLPEHIRISSNLPGTINGFLPFQAEGINFMLGTDRCVYYQWDTGTGKTIAAEGTILAKLEGGYADGYGLDVCFYVVKPNNLVGAQRKLLAHTGLDSVILDGTPTKREKLITEAYYADDPNILIFNAEKFREDCEGLRYLVEGRNVLVIYDEMPTKYSNRTTALYRSTSEVLYKSFVKSGQGKNRGKKVYYPNYDAIRPRGLFSVALSATPIINSPEGFFNCVRLMDSSVYGSVQDFINRHAGPRDPWGNIMWWKGLDEIGAKAKRIIHRVDKRTDSTIRNQFPKKLPPETVYCDLDKLSAKLYTTLQREYRNIGALSILSYQEVLSAIECLQMLCSNPRSVLVSARIREDYNNKLEEFLRTQPTKLEIKTFEKRYREGNEVALKLRQLVGDDSRFSDEHKGECIVSKMLELRERIERHDDKVIVFSTRNETLLPFISEWFDRWNISHVIYRGGLTAAEGQEVIDEFRTNPDVKVFLSSDAGSDSIDLPEATLTIHYDLPWHKAKMIQRENRQDRIDSAKEAVQVVTLIVPNTVEDRKLEIIAKKESYHNQVFDQIDDNEPAESVDTSDLLYILSGERD